MEELEKDLTTDEKTLAAFCLLLSDSAFDVWTGSAPVTEETYQEIFKTSAKFQSAALTIKLCEKFGSFAAQL